MTNWNEAVQVIEDAHADTLEILANKLTEWITGNTAVTFNLTTGNFTVDSLPQIQAGTTTVVAGENLSANTPVKLVDDSGTTKAYALDEEGFVESSMSSGDIIAVYYSSTYDRILAIYDGGSEDIQGRIGTVNANGTITFGAETEIRATGTSISDIKIMKISGDEFVVAVIDDEETILRGGKFSDASTLSLGVECSTGTANVKAHRVATDESSLISLVTISDDGSANYTLDSEIFQFTTGTSAIAGVAGSDNNIYTSADYGNDFIFNDSAFDICYNSDDGVFHCLYSYIDDSETDSFLMHCQIAASDGTLSTPNQIYTISSSIGWWFPNGMKWDTGNSQLLTFLAVPNSSSGTFSIYLQRCVITSNNAIPLDLTYISAYLPNPAFPDVYRFIPYFDLSRGEAYVLYSHYNISKSYLVQINVEYGNDRLMNITNYNDTKYAGYDITKTDSVLVFGSYASNKAYVHILDERPNFIGVVTETKSLGQNVTLCPIGYKASSFSSLTTGSTYYLQSDLSITTTKSAHPIGKALSSTTLQLFQ